MKGERGMKKDWVDFKLIRERVGIVDILEHYELFNEAHVDDPPTPGLSAGLPDITGQRFGLRHGPSAVLSRFDPQRRPAACHRWNTARAN